MSEPLTPEEEAALRLIAAEWRREPTVNVDSGYAGLAIERCLATLDAARAATPAAPDTTCENCGKVAEVDAETGDCRECFDRAATPAAPDPETEMIQRNLPPLPLNDNNGPWCSCGQPLGHKVPNVDCSPVATPAARPALPPSDPALMSGHRPDPDSPQWATPAAPEAREPFYHDDGSLCPDWGDHSNHGAIVRSLRGAATPAAPSTYASGIGEPDNTIHDRRNFEWATPAAPEAPQHVYYCRTCGKTRFVEWLHRDCPPDPVEPRTRRDIANDHDRGGNGHTLGRKDCPRCATLSETSA